MDKGLTQHDASASRFIDRADAHAVPFFGTVLARFLKLETQTVEVIIMKKSIALVTSCGLFSLSHVASSTAATASPPLPEVQMYQGVPFVSGGVSLDEREAMRPLTQEDNVQLIFARSDGAYLSDASVDIRNARGQTVLETVTNGPWLFTKLPTGTYTIVATIDGHTQRRVIHVPRFGQAQFLFSWNKATLPEYQQHLTSR